MIKAKIRWCSCMENILTLGKLQTLHLSRKLRDSTEFLPLYLSLTDTPKSLDCPGNSPNEVARENNHC